MSRPLDTSPAIWARMQAGLAKMTPRQRTERAAALTVLAHSFALADIRAQHPHESAQEHRYRLAVRLYGESFMQRVTSKSRD